MPESHSCRLNHMTLYLFQHLNNNTSLMVFDIATPGFHSCLAQFAVSVSSFLTRMSWQEHIVMDCDDDTPEFHNRLVMLLRDRVQALMDSYINSLPEGMSRKPVEQRNLGVKIHNSARMYSCLHACTQALTHTHTCMHTHTHTHTKHKYTHTE